MQWWLLGKLVGLFYFYYNGWVLLWLFFLIEIVIPVAEAKCFIDGLKAIGWHWTRTNPTTIDTGMLHKNDIKAYNFLRESQQVGCADTKFNL